MTPLHTLIKLSRALGRDPLLVQAGGGNVSVKLNKNDMLIKASGARLREVAARRGWARAGFHRIVEHLPALSRPRSAAKRELKYADLLGRIGRAGGPRVSMEAGLHAVLPDVCIAHVHSVAGIVLGMMPRSLALKWVRDILGRPVDIHFVPVSLPGLELTTHIAAQARDRLPQQTALWILKNHGIVWTAFQANDILQMSARLEKSLRARLGLRLYTLPHHPGARGCRRKPAPLPSSSWRELCLCHWPRCFFDFRALFPDFAIYFDLWSGAEPDLVKTWTRGVRIRSTGKGPFENRKEVFYAHALVSTLAHHKGWLTRLPDSMSRTIKGLETERLRLAQAGAA